MLITMRYRTRPTMTTGEMPRITMFRIILLVRVVVTYSQTSSTTVLNYFPTQRRHVRTMKDRKTVVIASHVQKNAYATA
jgi:hypothetical protein